MPCSHDRSHAHANIQSYTAHTSSKPTRQYHKKTIGGMAAASFMLLSLMILSNYISRASRPHLESQKKYCKWIIQEKRAAEEYISAYNKYKHEQWKAQYQALVDQHEEQRNILDQQAHNFLEAFNEGVLDIQNKHEQWAQQYQTTQQIHQNQMHMIKIQHYHDLQSKQQAEDNKLKLWSQQEEAKINCRIKIKNSAYNNIKMQWEKSIHNAQELHHMFSHPLYPVKSLNLTTDQPLETCMYKILALPTYNILLHIPQDMPSTVEQVLQLNPKQTRHILLKFVANIPRLPIILNFATDHLSNYEKLIIALRIINTWKPLQKIVDR